jgi:peptidylprolyl isomerase
MTQAKRGDTVRIHYTGKLTDGTRFDTSREREPLEFKLGAGQIIPGLDREVKGMEVGTKTTVTIPAADAYGEHDPAQVQAIPRSKIPEDIEVDEGHRLQAMTSDGREISLTVVGVGDKEVTVDANHPLAGKDLVFDVELVEIVAA